LKTHHEKLKVICDEVMIFVEANAVMGQFFQCVVLAALLLLGILSKIHTTSTFV